MKDIKRIKLTIEPLQIPFNIRFRLSMWDDENRYAISKDISHIDMNQAIKLLPNIAKLLLKSLQEKNKL